MSKQYLITVLSILLFAIPVRSQDADRLQVVGKAIFKATPENFVLQIDLKATDSIYERCSKALLNKLERMQEELLAKGLEREQVRTQDLSMSEQFEFVDGKRVKTGYVGTARLQIQDKYDPNKLGAVLQVPEKHNANYGLSFALTDTQKDALTEKAIQAAVEDATNKAELIAGASGVELVKISKINYESSNFGNYQLIQEDQVSAAFKDSSQELDLSPKAIEIRKSVAMEWQIKM